MKRHVTLPLPDPHTLHRGVNTYINDIQFRRYPMRQLVTLMRIKSGARVYATLCVARFIARLV